MYRREEYGISSHLTVRLDTTSPTLSVLGEGLAYIGEPYDIIITSDEPLGNMQDLRVNGELVAFTRVGETSYVHTVVPEAVGVVRVEGELSDRVLNKAPVNIVIPVLKAAIEQVLVTSVSYEAEIVSAGIKGFLTSTQCEADVTIQRGVNRGD